MEIKNAIGSVLKYGDYGTLKHQKDLKKSSLHHIHRCRHSPNSSCPSSWKLNTQGAKRKRERAEGEAWLNKHSKYPIPELKLAQTGFPSSPRGDLLSWQHPIFCVECTAFTIQVQSNWKISVAGFSLLILTSILNAQFVILPVSCLTFITCWLCVWFVSMCLTLVGLHKLLQKNEPLQFGLKKITASQKQKDELKPNSDRVQKLTSDIDKYFISKWYDNVSNDDGFTEEKEVISRLAEVQLAVNNKVLLHGSLNIYLRHLKEFRRSLKRKEKYSGSIEELYRYSHICSSSTKPKDYFLHQLTTNLLRHFINSELWNSLPCHVLVSVLARKLVLHILNLSSNPEILNYTMLNLIASKSMREKYNLVDYTRISISQYYDVRDSAQKSNKTTSEQLIEAPVNTKVEDIKFEEVSKPVDQKVANDADTSETVIDAKANVKPEIELPKKEEPVQQTRSPEKNNISIDNKEKKKSPSKKRIEIAEEPKEKLFKDTRTVSDPVKIHEPKNKNAKTWYDSKDILGISLGGGPLDALQATPVRARLAELNQIIVVMVHHQPLQISC
ncbi:hypothetical protein NQ315_010013 [Exocentrus adspersus]|uniref:PXA domain-containing protein n=1 Tax=Exocentrus adspersus TaxID=1586481 RepID=A0AAV8VK59_9CUCU|nr:hypothetical protein NQ315_010013 [Exocentrus adspersus]